MKVSELMWETCMRLMSYNGEFNTRGFELRYHICTRLVLPFVRKTCKNYGVIPLHP